MANIRTILVPEEDLEHIIRWEINKANDVKIAVFFVKKQMYDKLKGVLLKKNVQFAIGCDFYNTEQAVLEDILNEIKAGASWECRLYNFPVSGKTFHIKTYIFKKSDDVTVIIGSSNVSKGGFSDNFEYNVLISGKASDPEIRDVLVNFDKIFSNGVRLNDDLVKQYKKDYRHIKKTKENVKKEIYKIKMSDIGSKKIILVGQCLNEHKSDLSTWWKTKRGPWAVPNECDARLRFYNSKKKLIDKIKRGRTLSKRELIELFGGKYPLFDLDNIIRTEGGYSRKNPDIFVEKEIINKNGEKKLNKELKELLYGKKPVTDRIERFCNKILIGGKDKHPWGLATQLLMLAHGDKYPHLNGKAKKGLKEIFKDLASPYSPAKYDAFVKDMEIVKRTYLRTVGQQCPKLPIYLEIDALFEFITWKEKMKKKGGMK